MVSSVTMRRGPPSRLCRSTNALYRRRHLVIGPGSAMAHSASSWLIWVPVNPSAKTRASCSRTSGGHASIRGAHQPHLRSEAKSHALSDSPAAEVRRWLRLPCDGTWPPMAEPERRDFDHPDTSFRRLSPSLPRPAGCQVAGMNEAELRDANERNDCRLARGDALLGGDLAAQVDRDRGHVEQNVHSVREALAEVLADPATKLWCSHGGMPRPFRLRRRSGSGGPVE